MIDSIKKLFAEYEKAFNVLDVEKQVPFFAEHFISAGPRGSIAQGRDVCQTKCLLKMRKLSGRILKD